ncbi:MAG: hypothetical protein KAY37_01070 [Phycisphaerae bacterium]|nr:hypothetical protein [Phycisphaerae bacterium]
MAINIWRGVTSAVAQVSTATPATVEVGDIFTLTITDDLGNTASVNFTATAATVANVTAGLTAAWNASVDPLLVEITAGDDTTHVTLTADTAGAPFALSSSTTDGGGNDTQTLTVATSTANKGPNDYGVAENWSLGAAPVATNDVVVPAGAPPILYGLNQSSVAIGDFIVEAGFGGNIGRFANGRLYDLRIDPDSLDIKGSGGLVAIDVGSAAIAVALDHSGSPTAVGRQVVYLQGSALTTIEQKNGTVGLATYAGQSATVTSGFDVTGGTLYIDADVTVSGTTLRIAGGASVYASAAIPTVLNHGTFRQQAGNWTTLDNWGAVYPNANGTYATTVNHPGGRLLNSEDMRAKTFTNMTVYDDGEINDPFGRITWTNEIQYPNGSAAATLDFGGKMKMMPSPI